MKKIFIAEDDKYLRRLYERAFTNAGYEVALAEDGETALKNLRGMDTPPAVIILDVRLANMSGLQVLTELRKEKRYESVPVAVLTNSGSGDSEASFRKLGVKLYMVKIDHEPQAVVRQVEALVNENH